MTSESRHTHDGLHSPDVSRLGSEEGLDLPELTPFNGSVKVEDQLGDPVPTLLMLPTLYAPHRYATHPTLSDRRLVALEHGGAATGKAHLGNAGTLSRRLITGVFKEESTMLDVLLQNCEKVRTTTGFAYRVNRNAYSKLLARLYRSKQTIGEMFVVNGEVSPALPSWGADGNIANFYLENEYEILGICFRTEAEHFLSEYNKQYDFSTGLPRNVDLLEAPVIPLVTQQPPTLKPQDYITSTPTIRRAAETTRDDVEFGGPRRRRQSNIYNLGEDELQKRGQHLIERQALRPPTRRMQEVLGDLTSSIRDEPPHLTKQNERPPLANPPGGDPSDDDDDDPFGGGPRRNLPQLRPRRQGGSNEGDSGKGLTPGKHEPHFDFKLKFENVPRWDGNTDTIVRWLAKINNLAQMSPVIYSQLGQVVPRRLEGSAETWYWSLPSAHREGLELNWGTLRKAISGYYMNRKWLDKQKSRAVRAYYRESSHVKETPSEYYIRKTELLNTVFSLDDSEIILEVMEGAPANWNTVLTTQMYVDVVEFQSAIRFHEDTLLRLDESRRERNYGTNYRDPRQDHPREHFNVRTHLVGTTNGKFPPPHFPKDDTNISRRSATPAQKGARPCRHCGSGCHWDNECKHAFQAAKTARANFTTQGGDDTTAQDEYDNLYYSLDGDAGISEVQGSTNAQDFHEPLQTSDISAGAFRAETTLEGKGSKEPLHTLRNLKTPLNRRSRRRLAREIGKSDATTHKVASNGMDKSMIELRKIMARPPGCTFLGASAIQAKALLGESEQEETTVIIDSGSDITLIAQDTLDSLISKPKLKTGQKINLIQVTGSSSISGYVTLDLVFQTPEGPVKINVEAYVVKGMTTPFILGNDFSDQYSISLLRNEGRTYLLFGDSQRKLEVQNSTGPLLINKAGSVFRVRVLPSQSNKSKLHRRNQKLRRRAKIRSSSSEVRATQRVVIPPLTSKAIPVNAYFPNQASTLFVERKLIRAGNIDEIFGAPDSFINAAVPTLHVSNFSTEPVVIPVGQVLGQGRNPSSWLDKRERLSNPDRAKITAYGNMIRQLINNQEQRDVPKEQCPTPETFTTRSESEIVSKAHLNATGEDDPLAEEPLEGGPKTAEPPGEEVPSSRLLEEIDISPDLSAEQREQLIQVLRANERAFGLDGRLGNYDEKVEITLKPGTVPISLPPFPASPAKREIIDKQMDAWIQLGVIEPSKSPWAAPVFIVYRNGKPRMVIDLRRFNENVIPDEFPLPKQDDILQALTGAQWLTTLDALAGFTQLTLTDNAAEKLAFRTHRGLWQFRRMPFGFRNGPSVFQRVMQNVLAPFLWIFALVYIDDIVIFSLTFEEHLTHIDRVFKAISEANITLSPPKCHFAYQSLLLLGQKVSRLGLSTHKEKVDAIVNLDTPRNISELQTFLGMMVYFSAYIPFYSWIAHPFFKLLKKDTPFTWDPVHQEAFELCKQVLTNAPVRGYAMPGLPYRVYTDACDLGLAGILQQVQPVQIRDLRGTRMYEKLKQAHSKGEPVPCLLPTLTKDFNDVPVPGKWAADFELTVVHVERVVCYWSRVLKSAERNYSPTEREALALKESLIKFQPYLEGERILAVTDHAALTWSKTFQNVNRRLLTWGTVFSAYPNLKIIHRAGRVHSNVDPISRLRRRIPPINGPLTDNIKPIEISTVDPLKDMYEELGPQFEDRLLNVAAHCIQVQDDSGDFAIDSGPISLRVGSTTDIKIPWVTSQSYSLLVGLEPTEIERWLQAYKSDKHFSEVLAQMKGGKGALYSQYHYSENGLIYFEDWQGNNRLCVPQDLRTEVMAQAHNIITEGAHPGYYRNYNRIASTYYWPKMSRDIKMYANTCDICQKSKPRRHAPTGLLRPIPIPEKPFEVVSMDFIPELPLSNGYDNILVIVDKLTKYAVFLPCTTKITEEETAKLFFEHIISKFGIPRQVITDRDTRWRNSFWQEICQLMGMTRSLTTAYHPQADGQTEVLNQQLEITLRAYIGPSRDDWSNYLDALALSYNSTPHTATTFPPAYLLFGFIPTTESKLINNTTFVPRVSEMNIATPEVMNTKASDMIEQFEAERNRAKEALLLGQVHQRNAYNKGRLDREFEEGDLVVLNPHTLELLKSEKGRGRKLLMKYDGPFEILRKLSPVTYQLRLPASYGIHPIINIAHLEQYQQSPQEFGDRPTRRLNRKDFEELPEVEVEAIIGERRRKVKSRHITEYKVRFIGFGPEGDEWKSKKGLGNAPQILSAWIKRRQGEQ